MNFRETGVQPNKVKFSCQREHFTSHNVGFIGILPAEPDYFAQLVEHQRRFAKLMPQLVDGIENLRAAQKLDFEITSSGKIEQHNPQ